MKSFISFVAWLLLGMLVFSACGQTVTKGPYLLTPGKTAVSILWETNTPAQGKMLFGEKGKLNSEQSGKLLGERNGNYLYRASISGLRPGMQYSYRLNLKKENGPLHDFRTAPPDGDSFSFVAMGDSRSNPGIFKMINEQVNKLNPDLIISMGDLVASGGDYSEWEKFYFTPAAAVIDHIPLISTLGDHEGSDDNGELFRYFLLPEMQTEKLWFSFDYGPAHFVSLDYRYPNNPEMIEWFKEDMSRSGAKWKFVYMHRPSYNLGGHRSNWGKGVWPALFRQYHVDIVFAGHSHEYERFYPVRPQQQPESWPVTYITTGGAGAGLYDVISNSFLAEAQSVNHLLLIKIDGNKLTLTAHKMDDSIFDSLTIVKAQGTPDKNYLANIKPQEELDLVSMFARAISFSISKIPVDSRPIKLSVTLDSEFGDNVPFNIQLTDSSAAHYKLEPAKGTLAPGHQLQLPLEILRNGDLTISRWGEISPALRLSANFVTPSGKVSVTGASIEYWPEPEEQNE